MQSLNTLNTMLFCPKCQQTYEEGTQRFCVNDGVRLHQQKHSQNSNQPTGVFSGIINKNAYFDENASQKNFSPNTVNNPVAKNPEIKNTQPGVLRPETPGTFSKLIKPDEIPSGRAPLGDRRVNPVGRVALTVENPNILLGQTIKGRYFIKSRVSQSAHSIKYSGIDKLKDDKKVVVRIYTGKLDGSDFSARIFADERVALSHINHPNIAKVFDSGELQEGNPFIISEHVKGISLKESFAGVNRFSIIQIARIIRQAANAVSEAHQNGVLHRNLNPENLILSVNEAGAEQIKISDFNIFSDKTRGDFSYLAPEQIGGKPTSFSSDIYSLAVIAFQMLTGKMPFHGLTSKELLKNQQTEVQNVSFISKMYVPKQADNVLKKALTFDPAERFQSVRDFGDDFYNAITSENENRLEPDTISLAVQNTEIQNDDFAVSLDSVLEETAVENNPEKIVPQVFAAPDVKFVETDVTKDEAIIAADFEEIELEIVKPYAPIKLQKPESGKKAIFPVKADKAEIPWERRSIEPIVEGGKSWTMFSILGIGLLVILSGLIFYYFVNQKVEPDFANTQTLENDKSENTQPLTSSEVQMDNNEIPPPARKIAQPENTLFFENTRENRSKELLKYYRDFYLYYPEDWQINKFDKNRAKIDDKFIDISKNDADGIPIEQFMVSYYDSLGTYDLDKINFPDIVKKASDDIKNSPLPNFQLVGDGQVMVNGWKAHEMKFQGEGTAMNGDKIKLWGRRFYIPAARSGIKKGLVVTLLATSLSKVNQSTNDLGEKGDLKTILSTFEPDQNF